MAQNEYHHSELAAPYPHAAIFDAFTIDRQGLRHGMCPNCSDRGPYWIPCHRCSSSPVIQPMCSECGYCLQHHLLDGQPYWFPYGEGDR
jgi:hypothetical protein